MKAVLMGVSLAVALSGGVQGQELLVNPGFEDLDLDGTFGDSWGSFGSAGFNAFFGPNGHASLFSDNPGNFGGVFQTGIAGAAGAEYRFDLVDVRLEGNVAADYRFGLEFFAADDATKIGDALSPISLATTGDGLSFSMTAFSPAGTAFVRPIIQYDNVVSTAGGQENAFVFEASLIVVPAPSVLGALGLAGVGLVRRRR